jgi:hypothetical protein
VEVEFLRQLVLGESIAPFRMLETVTAVIPLKDGVVMDSAMARASGHRHLQAWLAHLEEKWATHSNKQADGTLRMTLRDRLDHMRTLSDQGGPPAEFRIVYTASGTRISAAVLRNTDAIVEHKAYWTAAKSEDEALYVMAILNSATVLARITDLQPHGQRDKRDFDNLVWTLPIQEYDERIALHRDLAVAARRAAIVASEVFLAGLQHFTTRRRAIRNALEADGIAAEIEVMVDALLPP